MRITSGEPLALNSFYRRLEEEGFTMRRDTSTGVFRAHLDLTGERRLTLEALLPVRGEFFWERVRSWSDIGRKVRSEYEENVHVVQPGGIVTFSINYCNHSPSAVIYDPEEIRFKVPQLEDLGNDTYKWSYVSPKILAFAEAHKKSPSP